MKKMNVSTTRSHVTMYGIKQNRPDIARAYKSMVPGIQAAKVEYLALAQRGYPGVHLKLGEADGLLSVGNMATHDKRAINMPAFCVQGMMFILTFQGVLAVIVNHEKRLVHPGELLLMPPGTHFAIGDPVLSCVRFGWALLDVKASNLNTPWQWPSWLLLTDAEKNDLTCELKRRGVRIRKVSGAFIQSYTSLTMLSSRQKIPHRGSRLKQLSSLAMLALLESLQHDGYGRIEKVPASFRAVQKFLNQLPERLAEPWTIGTMAEACSLGVSKFSEQVNKLTAESPARYLARLRLEKACELLRKKNLPLRVIAQETGFSCVSYFSRAFLRFHHKSPTQFRDEALT